MPTTIGVNEIFESLQGEATFTGTPAVFVRLQGCAVGCPWCDTIHTWEQDPNNVRSLAEIVAKTADGPTFARATVGEIVEVVRLFRARHVVLTGGEPCQHDLAALTDELQGAGRSVQVETSGTQPVRVSAATWVTCSPKIDMPGGFAVREDAVARADEIKMPVGKPADVEKLRAFLATYRTTTANIWLQPLSRSPKATALCIDAAAEHGWRVSIQTHQFIGVR